MYSHKNKEASKKKKNLNDASTSIICFSEVSLHCSEDDYIYIYIYIYISWKKETILVPLSVALPISLPFMKEPHGQGQPLNGSFKLTLSWK